MEQVVANAHVASASAALLAGAAVLLFPKGTSRHRMLGTVYVAALLLVNVAALSLHRESTFGVFHVLAVASLVTIAVGLVPLLIGRRSPAVLATHAFCMAWSYAGLAAAGWGQLAAAVGQDAPSWVVPAVIGAVLCLSWVVISGRVPTTLERLLAE